MGSFLGLSAGINARWLDEFIDWCYMFTIEAGFQCVSDSGWFCGVSYGIRFYRASDFFADGDVWTFNVGYGFRNPLLKAK